ncbi:MAG: acetyl-CoA C-acyltransferase [Chloroflexota bacterium]|nr:MAG: acetyl-CoA C-acyltransferase [Chloroflexota bacterium]
MREVVIASPVRTPVGKFGGALRDVQVNELSVLVISEVIRRSGIDPAGIDGVVMGQSAANGENPNIGRIGVLEAGLPVEIPSLTVERQCGSGLQAIITAGLEVLSCATDVMIAGGVESMSNIEYYVTGSRWGSKLGHQTFYDRWDRSVERVSTERFGHVPNMIYTAENVAKLLNISREEQDEFAVLSHAKCIAAMDASKFKDEIVPVKVRGPKGKETIVDTDEHPRRDATLENLAKLKPILGGTVTAGNASGMNDGAAACLILSAEKAEELGIKPLAYLRGHTVTGIDPTIMGLGPVEAVQKLLKRSGLTLDQIDLIELNEAFAAQALGVLKQLGITDYSKVNVNGSGISLGHPIGCTGVRIMATLLHEMQRRNAKYAIETLCCGGGMGIAALIEKV